MRNYIKIVLVAVFALIAGYGVYTFQKTDVLSDLALANVEALAGGEGSGIGGKYQTMGWCTMFNMDYMC